MGEAKRRKTLGLSPKKNNTKTKFDYSPRVFEWLPLTINQRDNLIKLSIKASWFGIGGLVILWIVVRFIGPAAGWWTLADSFYVLATVFISLTAIVLVGLLFNAFIELELTSVPSVNFSLTIDSTLFLISKF